MSSNIKPMHLHLLPTTLAIARGLRIDNFSGWVITHKPMYLHLFTHYLGDSKGSSDGYFFQVGSLHINQCTYIFLPTTLAIARGLRMDNFQVGSLHISQCTYIFLPTTLAIARGLRMDNFTIWFITQVYQGP